MTSITPFNFNQGIGFGKGSRTGTQKAKNWTQNVDQETMDKIIKEILEQNSVKTRTPEADYLKMKTMYDTLEKKYNDPKTPEKENEKIRPILVAIQNLMYSKPLDFSFRDYNSKTAGDWVFTSQLIATGLLLAFTASSGGLLFLANAPAGLATASTALTAGACASLVASLGDINYYYNEISPKYTEPQREYLKRLTEYRNAMWFIFPELDPRKNPKARPLTLADFEAFIKEANKH